MTIYELLDKYEIKSNKIKNDKNANIFSVGEINVLFLINNSNAFKIKREWFNALSDKCNKYALFLFDKKDKKYYFIKFMKKNNWLSGSFIDCDKDELFLGKQVLNYTSSIGKFITEMKKYNV